MFQAMYGKAGLGWADLNSGGNKAAAAVDFGRSLLGWNKDAVAFFAVHCLIFKGDDSFAVQKDKRQKGIRSQGKGEVAVAGVVDTGKIRAASEQLSGPALKGFAGPLRSW